MSPRGLETPYTAIKDHLHLVVIDLEEADDAQEIFETLNALGTPLLPADLVKNFLFHLAESQHQDTEKLYTLLLGSLRHGESLLASGNPSGPLEAGADRPFPLPLPHNDGRG